MTGTAAGGATNLRVAQHLGIGDASAWRYLNDSEERWTGQLGTLAEIAYAPDERDGRATKAASPDGPPTTGASLGRLVDGGDTAPRDSATPTDNFPPSGHPTSVLRSEDMPASTITVSSINRSPELAPIGDRTLAEGTSLHVRVSAVEPDGHSITLTASGLPSFATFTDDLNGSGTLTLDPGFDDAGTFSDITITASDGDRSDSETLTITVGDVNRPPTLAPIGDRTLEEGTALDVAVSAIDPDGHPIGLTASGLPFFASFTDDGDGEGTLSLGPGFDDAGTFTDITITASDGELSDSETLTITVSDVNRPPELAPIGDRALEEGTALHVAVSAIDPDGHPLNLTASRLPSFATFTDDLDGRGTLRLAPGFDNAGTFSDITITASDGDLSDSETLTVTVSNVHSPPIGGGGSGTPTNGGSGPNHLPGPSNHAPVADDQAVSVDEDTAVAITLTGSDQDGDPLEFVVLTLPANGVLTVGPDPLTSTPFTLSLDTVTYTPSADFNGPDSFTFKVNDGTEHSNTAAVSIAVNPVSDAPVADDQAVIVGEDTSMAVTLTGSDLDGDALGFILLTLPTIGVLTVGTTTVATTPFALSGDTVTYTPSADFNGPDSFTFKVSDGALDSNAATVTITVVDEPPVADDQVVSLDEDTAVSITLTGADVDNDSLEFIVLTLPASGVLSAGPSTLTSTPFSLNLDTVTYTPSADFNGSDSFTFKVNDGTADSNTATVSITVNPVNDAPVADDQAVSVDEDTSVAITLTGNDIDGDPLKFIVVLTLPANGVLTDGTIVVTATPFALSGETVTYTPDPNFNGQDAFTFKANDGALDSNTATVSITVVDEPPLADDQAVSTSEDTAVTITLAGADADNDPLEFIVLTLPTNGVLTVGPGALTSAPFFLNLDTVTYMPNANFNGQDSFTFKVNDGVADSNTATVSITVEPINDAPVADDQAVSVDEDTSVAITLTGSDMDGDPLKFIVVLTLPVNGVLTDGTIAVTATPFVLSAATLSYTPDADFNGLDGFTFKVNDGLADSEIATVSITVIDEPPVANDQAVSLDEDTSVAITITGTDVDGGSLEFIVLTLPSSGVLSAGPSTLTSTPFSLSLNTVTYTPNLNFSGSDSFSFRVSDGMADSNAATVSITVNPVNDPPVANAQAVNTNQDTAVGITLTGSDVDGDPIAEFIVLTLPANGVLTAGLGEVVSTPFSMNLDAVTYTPNVGFSGQDAFNFKVNDGALDSNPATVSIIVNDVPVADDQAVSTDEDMAVAIILTGSDINGDSLEFIVLTLPTSGVLTVGPGTLTSTPFSLSLDTVTYIPNLDFNGSDSFTFKVNDVVVDSNTATVSITVDSVNDAPVADDQEVSMDEDLAVAITLTGSDVDGDSLEFIVLTLPANGVLTLGPGTLTATPFSLNLDTVTYTPNADFNGSDSFTFRLNDGMLDSNVATVSIVVTDDCLCARGKGFWKHQVSGLGQPHIEGPTLEVLLSIVRFASGIFDEEIALSGIADARLVLDGQRTTDAMPLGGSDSNSRSTDSTTTTTTRSSEQRRRRALAQTLAAWLNFAKGGIEGGELIDTSRDGIADTTFDSLMSEVESILSDPNATKADLDRAKDLAEAVNEHDKNNPECVE